VEGYILKPEGELQDRLEVGGIYWMRWEGSFEFGFGVYYQLVRRYIAHYKNVCLRIAIGSWWVLRNCWRYKI
jgi:hypothetical protein